MTADETVESSQPAETNSESEPATATKEEPDDEPYVCPPDLLLSPGVILPEFERQAAIIERTAVFIARNNTQMEIVLKTKQAGNPQFKFLNFDDKLNPFYKEMVRLIKTGRYIPKRRPVVELNAAGMSANDASGDNVRYSFLWIGSFET